MSILYNCHSDGDQYRISKFNDGEVESSYLCTADECQCPAGHRHTCRHRQMLPLFLKREAVDTFWFLDWDRKGWVSNEPSERSEFLSSTPEPTIAYEVRLPDDASGDDIAKAFGELMHSEPVALHAVEPLAKPSWRRI